MYELFLRTETLFTGLTAPILLAIGVPTLVVGLVLWLGGTRYSTAIVGLLGAVVGAAAGLIISQWLEWHLWLSMLVGAAALATASILLRNILILVLAVLVIAGLSGASYLAVLLDGMAPPSEPEAQSRSTYAVPYQSFTDMDPASRQAYVDEISGNEPSFRRRLGALLDDTWQTLTPHFWKFALSVVAGALVAVFLVWVIKKALVALAYSIVGAATLFVGVQAALLGVGYPAVSALEARPIIVPIAYASMAAFGWIFQLVLTRHPRPKKEGEKKSEASD